MFADEEIKDIPACDASDQLIGFRPNFSGSQPDQLTWSSNVSSGIASTRINQQPTEGGGRWSWQKDSFTHEFNHDWWTDEDRNVASFVSPSGFGASNLPFPDLEEEIKPEDLKEPEPVCTLKSEEPTPEPSSSHSCPEVSSTSNLTAAVPVQTSGVDVGNINLSVVACKIGETNSGQHFVKYLKHQGRTTKIWECGTCGREFQHQYSLMRHLPTHTDERNFHCFQCGKRFRQLSTLSQHRAIHSAARPYSCEVCRKTFNRVSTLISHRKTHSGNKPYKCHVCPKGFYQKGNLRNHLFTHTNERPYICNICNKGFNQQSNLVCHKNKVHVEESNVYLLPCTDNFTAPIQAQPCARRKLQPKTKQTISSTCNGQLSLISDSVQTMEVGSTSLSQDPYQLSVAQWNSMREESSFVPDLTAGVIVDPIKTYHMGVAQATRQTPFALLKLEHGTPVLVKVVDTNLPGGKQMLVTATAEDLRIGGKIIVSNDNQQMQATEGSGPVNGVAAAATSDIGGALQIRVPVVATVIQRLQPSGKLLLAIEEPHATATSLPANPLLPGQGVDSDQPEAGAAHGAVESCARSRCPVTGYATCEYPIFDHLQDHFVSDSTKNNTGAATAASAANNCAAAAQAPPPPVMAPTTPKPALPLPPLPPPLLASPCRGLESTDDLFVHLEQFPDQSASFCIQLSDSD